MNTNDESQAFPEGDLIAAIGGAVTSALPTDHAFRAAVYRGIQERSQSSNSATTESWWDRFPGVPWLRAAASLLPASVAPQAFAGTALKSPVAKGLLGKSLGAALVPLFVGGLAVASFTSSLHRTVGLDGARGRVQSDELGRLAFTGWVSGHRLVAVGVLLLFVGLLFVSPLDAGVFVIAASMLSIALVARRLSDRGLADRKALGAHIMGVTMQAMLVLSLIGIVALGKRSPSGTLMSVTGYGLFLFSVLGTSPFQPRRWFSKKAPLTPKLRRMDAAVSIMIAVALAGCWMGMMGVGDPVHSLMKPMLSGELNPLDLRLSMAAALYVAFVTMVMARAPMPRPRGRRRRKSVEGNE